MNWPLFDRIPAPSDLQPGTLLDRFLDFVREKKISLYSTQEEAILEIYSGKNVILNTPTGSGKSLVALALHFYAIAYKNRSAYISPIKALVNEKFLSLCKEFGPEQVGMITGDAAINPQALILCCTAEILANQALRKGSKCDLIDIILDEFHYYSDRERGIAWQVPLLTLSQSRFLLMSATLGDTRQFEESLSKLNQRETVLIQSKERPVALSFEYSETPLHETVSRLLKNDRAPIYLVNFTQRECCEEAQNFLSIDFCTKEEKKIIQELIIGTRFSSPYGKEISKLLKHGVGIHHAGLLPKYRLLVEKLAQRGLLKIICGTDTLGVGVNVPIRTVLFTKLCKFDGEKTSILSVRDFQQISGRAGRKGYDTQGFVICQAPAHVIENLRLDQKAGGDPKKIRKTVKRKPPEKGFIPWNKDTLMRLVSGQSEPLISRFKVSHSMLLHVLSRSHEDGCKAMQILIRNSHESESAKYKHRKTAFQLFRSLIDRKIIEFNPLRVNVDLQEDFSLNQTLSLYLLDTLLLLNPLSPDYAVDLLSLVESILENPDIILRKQLDRMKSEKIEELKMSGVEYDARMEELEKLEYPKPNRDFTYQTFNQFAATYPWIGQENIKPKSIAREMYENFQSFSEYIRDYGLQRAEGILLRYLSDVYKTLTQTVPETAKNDEIASILIYLHSIVHQVDSSLLDEWEKLKNPQWISKESLETSSKLLINSESISQNITANRKKFSIKIRNEIFHIVRTLARNEFELTLSLLEFTQVQSEKKWSIFDLEQVMNEYYNSQHSKICTNSQARDPKNTLFLKDDGPIWKIQQILIDPEGHNDWALNFNLGLEASQAASHPILELTHIGPL